MLADALVAAHAEEHGNLAPKSPAEQYVWLLGLARRAYEQGRRSAPGTILPPSFKTKA